MMGENKLDICGRILEKCQQQHWYGGDEHNTAQFSERDARYEEHINTQGELIVVDRDPDDHPRKAGLAYAPATEEELRVTEQELGFPLPAFLRMLYSQVANGGFGPGYGLIGAMGGFDEAGNVVEMYQYHTARAQLIDLEQIENSSQSIVELELPHTVWPCYMLYLCDWGDARCSCLDSVTGRVFLVRMGEKYHRYILEVQAASLEEWWEQWLVEKPQEKSPQKPFMAQKPDFDPFLDNDDWP